MKFLTFLSHPRALNPQIQQLRKVIGFQPNPHFPRPATWSKVFGQDMPGEDLCFSCFNNLEGLLEAMLFLCCFCFQHFGISLPSTFQDPASLIDIFLFTNVFSCFIEPFVLDLGVVQLHVPVGFWTCFKIDYDREVPRSFAILVSERRLWVLQCWTPSNLECFFQSFPEICGLLCFSQILLRSLFAIFAYISHSALSSPQPFNVKPQNMRLMAVGCWLRSGVPFLGDGLPGVRFTIHQICSFTDFSFHLIPLLK